ncbi:farnesol dehydrogenase-like [Myzus persicae]|uniref:farnesol dehydrogenase-like n=1 Tax=Myzus persicae TaxID=13164 RepID=UPI000B9375DE|nr:farnesol dehydrogenase-like [Myzus persicae]XP_022178823.1 farnesol dehydrogenase-like [Myzus persicae]XP_022178824.1 farnesol dehydrogenase-like [Myzus persicae]XP_022178825.1 farnesol dehydrogenase-like [Myzus persicae]XP_022178826.1 farnesol dehydrogenase-like [Myzus persicae]XP_022178827.1 farnesol dehydrogenase-like [Myzus persicae]XP_022178828.1 farnesol dehydrogenase-like [Myzus persicae]XP_022178829.1 farnesol dehydrogenase-like [Myzus persicae]
MDKWVGKVAVVTGASSGIGAATCRRLVDSGMIVVGFARREDRLEELRKELIGKPGEFHYYIVDLCSEQNIQEAFSWIKSTLKSVHVLVNNAGVWKSSDALGNPHDWKLMFDTNVLGPSICSKEAVNIMKELKIIGHIVNINSDIGHYPPTLMANMSVYSATKFSSVSITESLRELLALHNLPIRVTSISPGLVDTEMVEYHIPGAPMLKPSNIADAIVYALASPQYVNISEILIRPTSETMLPFIKDAFQELNINL